MAPRKKTAVKKAAPAAEAEYKEPKAKPRKAAAPAKKVTRRAAAAHAPVVTHEPPLVHKQERDTGAAHAHTYAGHRSDSYKHYASIMKTIIVFLAFVLALAVLANIFSPSFNAGIQADSGQRFVSSQQSGYNSQTGEQYRQYSYTAPNPVPAPPKP